jgi:hypothetical protein
MHTVVAEAVKRLLGLGVDGRLAVVTGGAEADYGSS